MRILFAGILAFRILHGAALAITARPCIAGDACWIEYTVSNPGSGELRLYDPKSEGDHAPAFFLNGKPLRAGRSIPASFITLAAGAKVEDSFRLDLLISIQPGEYELRAVLELQGARVASDNIRLTVEPFQQKLLRMTPLPLGSPDRIVVSGLRRRQLVEQTFIAEPEEGLVRREASVVRTTVPSTATELTTALSGVHTEEASPLRWSFWRDRERVYAAGPTGLRELPFLDLPQAGAILIEQPLMGALHRADIFYAGGAAANRRLIVGRFCDPSVTPHEKNRILVNFLPLPRGSVTLALDPPELGLDRRHVLIVAAGQNEMIVYHATLSGSSGVLSPFLRIAFRLPVAIAALPDGRARGYIESDGSVHVCLPAVDSHNRRKIVWVDADLSKSEPLVRRFDAEADVIDSRASATGIAAWWLANGKLAVAQNETGKMRTVTPGSLTSRDIMRLSGAVYLVTTDTSGVALLQLPVN